MDICNLFSSLNLNLSLINEIENLVFLTAGTNDNDSIPRISTLDELIILLLKEKIEKKKINMHNKKFIKKINHIFKKLIYVQEWIYLFCCMNTKPQTNNNKDTKGEMSF